MPPPDRPGRPPARPAPVPARRGRRSADELSDALLQWSTATPVALVLAADDGCVHWVNAAFESLTGFPAVAALGRTLASLLDGPLADPWPVDGRLARRALHARDGREIPCDVHAAPAGPGRWMFTLVDRSGDGALRREVARYQSMLEFVQDSVRIGLWERSVHDGSGHWDPHMFRFWGLDPAGGTPSVAEVTRATLPQDELRAALVASQARPGRYSHRFRLLGDDGQVRRVRAHWEVRAVADGTPDRLVGLVMDDTETYSLASSLDQAHVQLQLAMDLTDLALWRHDFRTGRLHFSDRAFAMLGLPPRPEGMTLDEVRELTHPDDLAEAAACFARALQSHGVEDMQLRYRHADGSWRHVLTRRVTQRDGQGRPIAFNGVMLDISSQVERLQRATGLARQLDDVAAASGIGIWRVAADGRRTEWNAQMYAIFGLPPHEPPPSLADWAERCVHPDDRVRVREAARDWMVSSAPPKEIAHRVLLPDGRVRHVVDRGRFEPPGGPYRVAGVTIDVTEREQAQQALRDATERGTLAMRAAGIGAWEWHAETGESRWDEQMYRLRGLPPRSGPAPEADEMMTRVHPDDRPWMTEMFMRATRGEADTLEYEFRIVRPDGAVRRLASRSQTVRDAQGAVAMRLGINWDVTDLREAESARQERALALRESQAKSELLARMSHELRTPMNAILGFTQLLLADDMDPQSPRHLRLEHIRAAGEHLLTLINNVLELSRLDGHDVRVVLQPVRIGPLVLQALPLVERLAESHEVTVLTVPTALQVRADPTRLKQVVVNLLTNAIKYNRRGGRVTVEAVADEVSGTVALRVTDTGVGMTADQQAEVFEPFNRAGAERQDIEGTGIGLTIVQALVARMGGRVRVESTPGVGSVFEVRLDAILPVVPYLPRERTTGSRRVLYIEDNPVNVLIVAELVRRRGDLEFETAADGTSGVRSALGTPPGLVLVDMQLPDIEGLEVLRRLRAHPSTAGLPCIALSANAIPGDIERALQAGFDEYWTKPLDFGVFGAAMDRVFGPEGR